MKIKDPKEFIENVEEYSNNKIFCKDDALIIIGMASREDLITVDELSFAAKYIKGLMSIAKSAPNNPEVTNIAQINSDLSENFTIFKNYLVELFKKNEGEETNMLREKYLEMNRESFLNLQKLIEDFNWIKLYLNHQKRSIT